VVYYGCRYLSPNHVSPAALPEVRLNGAGWTYGATYLGQSPVPGGGVPRAAADADGGGRCLRVWRIFFSDALFLLKRGTKRGKRGSKIPFSSSFYLERLRLQSCYSFLPNTMSGFISFVD
jgi:hypothetical protein